jgi:Inorganic H+ pyrophosphatase
MESELCERRMHEHAVNRTRADLGKPRKRGSSRQAEAAGGARDNAKKWIEAGKFGGKGSDAHKAAVVGDTAGDPMKDTAGPSLNIMLKLMSVISLMLAPVLMHFGGLI